MRVGGDQESRCGLQHRRHLMARCYWFLTRMRNRRPAHVEVALGERRERRPLHRQPGHVAGASCTES